MTARIEDYALIGDSQAAALVDNRGSIDWLCWPDFASEACFASLLGKEENGLWRISPCEGDWKTTRAYRDHTLILETTFHHANGVARLIDFMPVRERHSDIVRIVEGVRGKVPMRMELKLRFDYGRTIPWVTGIRDGIRAVAGQNLALLHSSVPVHGENLTTVADFTANKGERMWFTLSYGQSFKRDPGRIDAEKALKDTASFWVAWSSKLRYEGKYRNLVERSMITLKALTFRPTGGIVAAATSSLPEWIGGARNWDYRYCWLRDTTFTLMALTSGGYNEEAAAWQDWLLRALAGSPDQVQTIYGVKGERELVEWEADWLEGYEGSRPVRFGNAAAKQMQLDIYGEMLDCFFHAQRSMSVHGEDDFRVLALLLDHLENIWQEPDEGIWETRGGPRQFTYSKVMVWVAFDRAIKLAEQQNYKAPLEKWQRIRDAIHDDVCTRAFNAEKNSFVEHYGSDQLGAALLLMPQVGFLPYSDHRIKGTIEAIERELMPDGLVLRYDTERVKDGLPPGEGVFLACSFWMVSSLHALGRKRDARALFERLIGLCNDVGLLAEEYDTGGKRLLGNFPQAFSHIAMVVAAFDLEGPTGHTSRSAPHAVAREARARRR